MFERKTSNSDFEFIIDNMNNKLAGWKTKFLNMTGRPVLTKSSLSSIPSHIVPYIRIPKKVADTLNKIQRNFI